MSTHSIKIRWGEMAGVILFLLLFSAGTFASAQNSVNYTPIVNLPQLQDTNSRGLPDYINAVYVLLIILGSLIAVIRIAIAGVKYSLDEVVTHKQEAKDDIKGVLLGLAILLIPYIVLNTINSDLTNLDVLQAGRESRVNLTPSRATPTSPTQSFNQATLDLCAPRPGTALPPACSAETSTADRQAAASCAGYYDTAVNICFSRNSAYTYDSSVGGNWGSRTDQGWVTLCGGEANVVITPDNTNNTISYNCK